MNSKGDYREIPINFILLKETKPEYREKEQPHLNNLIKRRNLRKLREENKRNRLQRIHPNWNTH
jgi:hypothetical protein